MLVYNTDMNKIFLCLFFGLLVLLPFSARAESISNFSTKIQVLPNAEIKVVETISYDFGALSRHGIFRYIPIKYKRSGGNYTIKIRDISVTDQAGRPYKYSVSYPGENIEIKIGDPDSTISGEHTYVLGYTVKKAINYFTDHDELYWNVTGNGWPVEISNASAEVWMPQNTDMEKVIYECFFGVVGASASCISKDKQDIVSFSQENLNVGEGLTVVLGFPKGVVSQPSAMQNILEVIKDNYMLSLPLFALFFMLWLWSKKGRDPKISTIVPEYEAPDSLTPAEVGVLADEKADNKDISAELINLAVLGYIKITQTEKKILGLFTSTEYSLELLKPTDEHLTPLQAKFIEGVFGKVLLPLPKVLLSSLETEFYKDLEKLKDIAYGSMVSKEYFLSQPDKTRRWYQVLAGICFFIGVLMVIWQQNVYWLVGMAGAGLVVFVFSFFMPKKTLKGAEVKAKVLGLKLYLSVAEKDRIDFHNAPEKTPEKFEKLLPFAMALGVETQWAKKFEGIYTQPPGWFSGTSGTFNSILFINALSNFSATTQNTFSAVPPGSAGSGGSGFSGGSSGGGFGGGGGGSW